jgi:acyl carrier protein
MIGSPVAPAAPLPEAGEATMSVQTDEATEYAELRGMIAGILDVDDELVTGQAHFINDLGVDSLMALEVMVGLEKRYQIKVSEDELRQISCLDNVYELLKAKRA